MSESVYHEQSDIKHNGLTRISQQRSPRALQDNRQSNQTVMQLQEVGSAVSSSLVEPDFSQSANVMQAYWFRVDDDVMWLDGEPDEETMMVTDETHSDETHEEGPVWIVKPEEEEQVADLPNVLSDQGDDVDWLELDDGPVDEGPTPGITSVKDNRPEADGMPALEGPTEYWVPGPQNFGDLGWDDPVSQARITTPVYPQVHVTFWCKVGDVDVMIHLRQAGYALIYGADGAPGELGEDTTVQGLTGKDLYAQFLQIARDAGGYREGANECQTFANNMLASLQQAVDDTGEGDDFDIF